MHKIRGMLLLLLLLLLLLFQFETCVQKNSSQVDLFYKKYHVLYEVRKKESREPKKIKIEGNKRNDCIKKKMIEFAVISVLITYMIFLRQ